MEIEYEIIFTIQKESCTLTLDFILRFLAMAESKRACLCSFGLTKTFHSLHKSEVSWVDFNKIDDFRCVMAVFKSKNNR